MGQRDDCAEFRLRDRRMWRPLSQPQCPAVYTAASGSMRTLHTDSRPHVRHTGEGGFEQEEAGVGDFRRLWQPARRQVVGTRTEVRAGRVNSEETRQTRGLATPGGSGTLARAGAQPRDALKWSPCLDSKGVLFPGTSDQRTLFEDSEPLLPCLCRTHERRRPIPAGEEAGKAVSFRSKQRRRVTSARLATAGGDGDSSGRGKRSRAVRGHALSPRTRACSLKPSQKEAASTCCFWGVEGGAPHVSWGAPWPPVTTAASPSS